jgi:hypothetical protein
VSWHSSVVEQLICNQQVAGSNPVASSSSFGARVAQLVEHPHGKGEVVGSNPIAGSIKKSGGYIQMSGGIFG